MLCIPNSLTHLLWFVCCLGCRCRWASAFSTRARCRSGGCGGPSSSIWISIFFFLILFASSLSCLIPADCTGANPISDTSPTTSVTSKRRGGGSGGTILKRENEGEIKRTFVAASAVQRDHTSRSDERRIRRSIALVFYFLSLSSSTLTYHSSSLFSRIKLLSSPSNTSWYTFSEVPQLSCGTTDSNN